MWKQEQLRHLDSMHRAPSSSEKSHEDGAHERLPEGGDGFRSKVLENSGPGPASHRDDPGQVPVHFVEPPSVRCATRIDERCGQLIGATELVVSSHEVRQSGPPCESHPARLPLGEGCVVLVTLVILVGLSVPSVLSASLALLSRQLPLLPL